MKNIILIIFLLLTISCFSQNRKDTIVGKINTEYLSELVLDVLNERRALSNISLVKLGKNVYNCAEYQAAYMSTFSKLSHSNGNFFRGVHLNELNDRLSYFNVKSERISYEVGTATYTYVLGHYFFTYEEFANHIIDNLFQSKTHKLCMMSNRSVFAGFSCKYGIFNGREVIYTCGVFD